MSILPPSPSEKQLVLVAKSGPAFKLDDLAAAHSELDLAGVPRNVEDRALSLTSRIAFLRGQLETLRHALRERAQ